MDKYLLAENPMSDNGCMAIIRTVAPIAIFEVIEGRVKCSKWHKYYQFMNSDDELETYTIEVFHYFIPGVTSIEEVGADYVYKQLDDAWHWFKAYIKWFDEN